MNTDFNGAMRAAVQLTRNGRLMDATRVIQNALSRRGDPAQSHASPEKSGAPENLRLLDLTADSPDTREKETADTDAQPASHYGDIPRSMIGTRVARPLGQVIRTLREARRRVSSLEAFRPAKPARAPDVPDGAQLLTRSFTCRAGSRAYKLYVPRNANVGRRSLLVMLHGCTQDPDDFAIGTRMNLLAEEQGLIVAYPGQPKSANPSACWNWFSPGHQMRDAGEALILAGITQEIIAEYDIDPDRVFVAGLSAGGAMAAVMGAAYPEIYAAVGVHSGLPYRSASDVVSAFGAMRGDPAPNAGLRRGAGDPAEPTRVRTIVFHGEADQTVHPSNAARFVEPHIDAGLQVVEADVRHSARRAATRTIVRDGNGSVLVERWLIAGAGHAWSGGSAEGSYTDPTGPDASREMLRFFLQRE